MLGHISDTASANGHGCYARLTEGSDLVLLRRTFCLGIDISSASGPTSGSTSGSASGSTSGSTSNDWSRSLWSGGVEGGVTGESTSAPGETGGDLESIVDGLSGAGWLF